jgi:hypothetical protein
MRRKHLLWPFLLLALAAACDEPSADAASDADVSDAAPDVSDLDAAPDMPADVPADVTTDVDATSDADAMPEDVGPIYPLERGLPDTELLGTRRGWRIARGLVHLHTIHSHDACDGEPRIDGLPNTACDDDWRVGVCSDRLDFVFNTDHEELGAWEEFETLLLMRPGDEPLQEDGATTAARLVCPDGFRVLVLPGGEYGVMPVGLKRHLDGTPEEREAKYEEVSAERVASLKELGAVVLQAHTESKSLDELRGLGLDGFEIYNLHANIDPDIREEFLGLDAFGYANDLAPFLRSNGPAPDLALLAFFAENPVALQTFDTLLAEGQHLVGTAGTDAHQNAIPFPLRDGERGDSFRRMMRFFSHHLLVQEVAPQALRDALRQGRLYIAFEVLGTPEGFDYHAQAGAVVEMGGEVLLADAPTLHVQAPTVLGWDGPLTLETRLLRAAPGGAVEVARTTDAALTFTPTEPGAYRVEVRITPHHLRPWLGAGQDPDRYLKPHVWIYANPIYVR